MIALWAIRVVSTASIAICCVVAIADAARGWPSGGLYLLYGAIAIVFIGVGWLIAERRPSNVVGPLLVGFGALFAWYLPADPYLHLPGQLPGDEYAALFVSMLDAPRFILVGLVLILFPVERAQIKWVVAATLVMMAAADVVARSVAPATTGLWLRGSTR